MDQNNELDKIVAGCHVLVRNEEFLVKKVSISNTNERYGNIEKLYRFDVEGTSELNRNIKFSFRSDIDKNIKLVNPANTRFIPDVSTNAKCSFIYMENELCNSYGIIEDDKDLNNKKIFVANCCAFNPMKYQYIPFLKMMDLSRPRFLIADDVGLGKTVEIGIILSEMIHRGRGQRILVCTMKSILAQFQEDIWNRFAIPLMRLDSSGVEQIRQDIPINENPFDYCEKAIVSIDTLKDPRFSSNIDKSWWDIVVVDEVHTAANENSMRGKLVKLLAERCTCLVFASATPHNGKPESFADIIKLLEPILIPEMTDYTSDEFLKNDGIKKECQKYWVRRVKKDVESEAGNAFKQREIKSLEFQLNDNEKEFLKLQQSFKENVLKSISLSSKIQYDLLFPIVLFKTFMSSPSATFESIENRLKKDDLEIKDIKAANAANNDSAESDNEETGHRKNSNRHSVLEIENEIKILNKLKNLIPVKEKGDFSGRDRDSRYCRFKKELVENLKWDGNKESERIVVFTESVETAKFLKQAVISDFKLDKCISESDCGENNNSVVKILFGGLTDIETEELVKDFSLGGSKIRMLISTDAGSLGINLHHYCHIVFNYDIPWSIITLEQRNGRIDRYGQENTPEIYYLIARTSNTTLSEKLSEQNNSKKDPVPDDNGDNSADLRILYKVYTKENEAYNVLGGEHGAVMELFTPEEQEERTAQELCKVANQEKQSDQSLNDELAAFFSDDEDEEEEKSNQAESDAGNKQEHNDKYKNISIEDLTSSRVSFYNGRKNVQDNIFDFFCDLFRTLKNEVPDKQLIIGDIKDIICDSNADNYHLKITLNDDLKRLLPIEAVPDENVINLSNNLSVINDAIKRSNNTTLKNHNKWADTQVLYTQHPIINYYMNMFDAQIGRGCATAVSSCDIPEGQAWYFCHSTKQNLSGDPVLSDFSVAITKLDEDEKGEKSLYCESILNLKDFLKDHPLFNVNGKQSLNTGCLYEGDLALISKGVKDVIDSPYGAYKFLKNKIESLDKNCQKNKDNLITKVESWEESSKKNINNSGRSLKRKDECIKKIESIFNNHNNYYNNTYNFATVNSNIRILSVFANLNLSENERGKAIKNEADVDEYLRTNS